MDPAVQIFKPSLKRTAGERRTRERSCETERNDRERESEYGRSETSGKEEERGRTGG